ncbi:roadblock/LC7 domain-containing protein [Nonomuraea sp. NBC_01738]|uniref:roadblock/LC7 domain-containing protein n=1 Tax=Nonomuraea sp. NBC_01738 TaxID=2976003 RepID=UPI002E1430BC|nr:roadblock/LC7 domain-containing protein [Nonomuraea sp. NBC_01738]
MTTDLSWLLNDLTKRVDHIDHVLVVTSDGLVLARSQHLREAEAGHLAAVTAALHSLAKAAAESEGCGQVLQTLVEWQHHLMRLTMAGTGACLAVLARRDVELGLLAYEMEMLIAKVGAYLSSPARGGGQAPGGTG